MTHIILTYPPSLPHVLVHPLKVVFEKRESACAEGWDSIARREFRFLRPRESPARQTSP